MGRSGGGVAELRSDLLHELDAIEAVFEATGQVGVAREELRSIRFSAAAAERGIFLESMEEAGILGPRWAALAESSP
jgi:hypothetical protein